MNSTAIRMRPTNAAMAVMARLHVPSRLTTTGRGRRGSALGLQPRQGDPALAHVLAGAVGIADLARLVALEEQELAGALVGVDLGGQRRGVRELEGDVALPPGLERGDVDDDPAPRIGRLAAADEEDVTRHPEIFDRVGEGEAVGRDDADVGLAVDEAV